MLRALLQKLSDACSAGTTQLDIGLAAAHARAQEELRSRAAAGPARHTRTPTQAVDKKKGG